MVEREQGTRFEPTGVDFYLFMDYNWNPCEAPGNEGRMYSWGAVIFGKAIQHKADKSELMEWTSKAYVDMVRSMVFELSLKDNAVAVALQGQEQCVMTGLTNNRSRITSCISRKNFYFEGYSGGALIPGFYSACEPYETLYASAMENRKAYPKRRAVGIVIRQSGFQYKSEKEEAVKYVKLCAENGIDVITIGLEDRSVQCKNPINSDEVKLLSTNSPYSVLCDYERLKGKLEKIAKDLGGAVDHWWEAGHAENWTVKQRFIDFGALEWNAHCCNEKAKQYYFGIAESDEPETGETPFQRFSYEEDHETAENFFEVGAQEGIGESMLYLGKIHREKALRLKGEGKADEAEREEVEAEKWLSEAAKKNCILENISKTRYLGILVDEIKEYSEDSLLEADFEKPGEKKNLLRIWVISAVIVLGALAVWYFTGK